MFGWFSAKIINFQHLKITLNWLNIDIFAAVNQNKVLLILAIYATCFSHVDHIQVLKYTTLKPKIKFIYIYIFLICEMA